MKPFDELTNQELADLTEEEVNYYRDIACATDGVQLLPIEPTEPVKPEVEKTVNMTEFKCSWGFYTSPQHAAKIIELIASETIYESEGSCGYEYVKPCDSDNWHHPKTSPALFVERSVYDKHLKELETYKSLKKKYDSEHSDFVSIRSKRKEAVGFISDKIDEAWRDVSHRDQVRGNYKRYLELSKGDNEIAMNFLIKAFPDLVFDDYADLLDELFPGYVWNSPQPAPEISEEVTPKS